MKKIIVILVALILFLSGYKLFSQDTMYHKLIIKGKLVVRDSTRLYGNFMNINGKNAIYNKPILGFQNFSGSAHVRGSDKFAAGIIQKSNDTAATLTFQDAYGTKRMGVHRKYISMYYDRRPGNASTLEIRKDSINIQIANILASVYDTTGALHHKKPLYLTDIATLGLSTDSVLVKNQTTGKIQLRPQAVSDSMLTNGNKSDTLANAYTGKFGLNAGKDNYNNYNTFIGLDAGRYSTGDHMTILGYQAGRYATGNGSTAIGYWACFGATGVQNTGIGQWALVSTITGYSNTAIGFDCLNQNIAGYQNTGVGIDALYMNNGSDNVGVGQGAGYHSKVSSNRNVFIGSDAGRGLGGLFDTPTSNINSNTLVGFRANLNLSTNDSNKVAIGNYAGFKDTVSTNIYIGAYSGYNNTSGTGNLFAGFEAGKDNISSSNNVMLGLYAGKQGLGSSNIAIGNAAMQSGNTSADDNVILGQMAGLNTNSDENVFIGKYAGITNSAGAYNVYLGSNAGLYNNSSRNVFLGYNAGYYNTGTDSLVIENSNERINPLIAGNFSTNQIKLGGDLTVAGSALFNDAVTVNGISIFNGTTTYTTGHTELGNSASDTTVITGFMEDDTYSNLFFGRNCPKIYTGTNGQNLFVGKPTATLALTTGYYNTILGNLAGDAITTGFSNVIIGYNALGASTATSSSVFIGQSAGSSVSSVTNSVTIGALAGQRIGGSDMVNLGFHAGLGESAATNSSRSIFIGSGSGENTYATPDDIGIGYAALANDSATGTGMNIAIGQYSCQNKRKGNYNTVIGSKAVQTLNKNVNSITAIGYNALNAWNKDTLAPALCVVGTNALSINSNAVFTGVFGSSAMANSTSGGYCNAFGYATLSEYAGAYSCAFGHEAGFSWQTGNYNNLIGMYCGRYQTTGAHNNYIGYNITDGVNVGGGSNNEYIGSEVSRFNSGSNNVMIGHNAGRGTVLNSHSGCVKIGYEAGYNDTLDNQLFIDNSNIATPLIYGDFSTNQFKINGTIVNSVDTLTRADATPDVSGRNVWKYSSTGNTVTVTITDFDNPVPNAIYTIIGQNDIGTLTINDGGNFSLAGGVNFTLGLNDILVLYCIADNNYIEVSRSDN